MKADPSKLGQWGALYDGIIKAGLDIQTDGNSQFQFVSTPQVASWGPNTNQYYADFWGNNAPFSLGPTTTGPQIDVSDAYFEFINSLVLPVPSSPEYDRLKAQLTSLANQRTSQVQESVGAYKVWKAKDGSLFPDIKTYSDWLASSTTNGPGYKTKIDDLDNQITSVKQQLRPYEKGINAAYVAAVEAADPGKMVEVTIPGSSDTKKIYNTRLTPELSEFMSTMTGGGKVHPLAVTLERNYDYSGEWYVETATGAGLDLGIFGFASEHEWSRDTKIERDSDFTATLHVQGLQTFNIQREDWMKTNMIAEHMVGPYAGQDQSEDMFFGDEGSLKLVPTQILVAYGTTFSVTTSSSYYKRVKEQWEAAAGFLIGPFFIGGEAGGNSLEVTQSGSSTTVSIGSNNDTNAYVIGISSMLFYDGE